MKISSKPNEVETFDLGLAAYLMTKNCQVISLNYNVATHKVLIKLSHETLDFKAEGLDFLNRKTLVEPVVFSEYKRFLRAAMYQIEQQQYPKNPKQWQEFKTQL